MMSVLFSWGGFFGISFVFAEVLKSFITLYKVLGLGLGQIPYLDHSGKNMMFVR